VARNVNIPFTVGGGINTLEDVSVLLNSGADKITINTAAFKNPALITEIAASTGSQCVVVAIDAKQEEDGTWYVYLNGGRTKTERECFSWAKEAEARGAGEILLTSMNHDGTKSGFALDITKAIGNAVGDSGDCIRRRRHAIAL
jgi:cyclase